MRRISVLNFKGGVGKTSLTTNLAYSLSSRGYKTLIVDCDMQANASGLIPKDQRLPITLTHVLRGENDLNEAIQKARENLYLVASDRNLNQAANYIVTVGLRGYNTLKNAIKKLDGFDFVFFDHSPSYNAISESAILASTEILIPCELAPYPVEGLLDMIQKLDETLAELEHEVDITGIIPFKLDKRYAITEIYLTDLKKTFNEQIKNPIRTDSTITRAQSMGQTVYEYDKNSKAVEDFNIITEMMLKKEVYT